MESRDNIDFFTDCFCKVCSCTIEKNCGCSCFRKNSISKISIVGDPFVFPPFLEKKPEINLGNNTNKEKLPIKGDPTPFPPSDPLL